MSQTIHEVEIVGKKRILDERGGVFHMLKCTDPEFRKFGEIYFSSVKPGYAKGWHVHSKMWLNYYLVTGEIEFVLYDDRAQSPTYGKYQSLIMNTSNPVLVKVPPFVWNGFRCVGNSEAIVANCASEPHDPQEISRKSLDDPYFKFDWKGAKGW